MIKNLIVKINNEKLNKEKYNKLIEWLELIDFFDKINIELKLINNFDI